MKTTNRRLVKFGLLAVALTLTPLALLPGAVAHGQSTTPPVAPGSVSMEITCTPDTFRPDEWVAIECVTHIKNNGDNAIPAGSVDVASESGPLPQYYWVSYFYSDEYGFIGAGDLSFRVPAIQPGETFESRVTELSRMEEGTWRGNASLVTDDQVIATVPLEEIASSDATAPPQNLDVTMTLLNGGPDDELTPLPSAIYETKIVNKGSAPITSLNLTQRIDNAKLDEADPRPFAESGKDEYPEYHFARWNLASFGLDSLEPGGSLLLRISFGPSDPSLCDSFSSGLLVEAGVGGMTERYGMSPPSSVLLGDCPIDVPGGRGGEDPTAKTFGSPGTIAFGRGGDGPGDATFDVVWTAAFLAVAGAGLVATALVVRRRLRS